MATNLKHLYRRLKRGRKHMKNFERQATRFIESIKYTVVSEKDSDGVKQLLRIKVKGGKEPPLSLSFIAGDCVHNLRSILDNLIWQLGNFSGCPQSVLKHLNFPICETSADFAAKLKRLKGFPQTAIDIIESLQPYQPYKGRTDPNLHPLWILNRLWNDDKHRSPSLMLTSHKSTAISPSSPMRIVQLPDGRRIRQSSLKGPITIHTGGRFQESKEIVTVTLYSSEPEPQFNVMFSFDIAFDERGPAKGLFASECLRNLHDFIRDEVLAPFEPIFPK